MLAATKPQESSLISLACFHMYKTSNKLSLEGCCEHSFIQQTFTESLLCVRLSFRCRSYISKLNRIPGPWRHLSMREDNLFNQFAPTGHVATTLRCFYTFMALLPLKQRVCFLYPASSEQMPRVYLCRSHCPLPALSWVQGATIHL